MTPLCVHGIAPCLPHPSSSPVLSPRDVSFEISSSRSEWMIIILATGSFFAQILLHSLENWVGRRHRNLAAVINVVYRELMILGLISFAFTVFETTAAPSKDVVIAFEIAHVYIFVLAVWYALVVFGTVLISLRMSTRWKRMERLDSEQYELLKAEHDTIVAQAELISTRVGRLYFWYCRYLCRLPRYRYLHEMISFHHARAQFLRGRGLPTNFQFSTFLRKVKSVVFFTLIESHRSLYIILLFFVLSNFLRRKIVLIDIDKEDLVDSILIICGALSINICTHVLAWKMRRVYNAVSHSTDSFMTKGLWTAEYPGVEVLPSEKLNESFQSVGYVSMGPDSNNHGNEKNEQSTQSSNLLSEPSSGSGTLQHNLLHPPPPRSRLCRNERGMRSRSHHEEIEVYHEPSLDKAMAKPTDAHNDHRRPSRLSPDISSPSDHCIIAMAPLEPETNQRGQSPCRRIPRASEECIIEVEPAPVRPPLHRTPIATAHDRPNKKSIRPKVDVSDSPPRRCFSRRRKDQHKKRDAPSQAPKRRFPLFVYKILPELDREVPMAERLFWFHSHKFFLWCVEFVMFFSTVLLSTSTTQITLTVLSRRVVGGIQIGAILAAVCNLLLVLLRIAGMIKKYIIVLHNAGLIPEITAAEMIQRVRQKPPVLVHADDGEGDEFIGAVSPGRRERAVQRLRKSLAVFQRGTHSDTNSADDELELGDLEEVDTPAEVAWPNTGGGVEVEAVMNMADATLGVPSNVIDDTTAHVEAGTHRGDVD